MTFSNGFVSLSIHLGFPASQYIDMMHTIGNVAPAGILREGNPEGRLRTRHLRWDEAQWDEGSWVRHLVLLVFPRDAGERREGHPAVFCSVR